MQPVAAQTEVFCQVQHREEHSARCGNMDVSLIFAMFRAVDSGVAAIKCFSNLRMDSDPSHTHTGFFFIYLALVPGDGVEGHTAMTHLSPLNGGETNGA